MPSFPEPGRPSDESAEELRRKERERERERELADAEAKVARRQQAANRLLGLRIALAAAEAATGNPAYRSAGMVVQWAVERLQNSE